MASRAIFTKGNIGECLELLLELDQGNLLPHKLLKNFLEQIIPKPLEDYGAGMSTGGKRVTALQFADNIDELIGKLHDLRGGN